MFCPRCGTEYREGVTRCAECDVELTADPPEPVAEPVPEWEELATVLATSDATLIPVVKSLLEAEGIPCFARGEGLQEFMGLGRLGAGTNLVTGLVEIQVPKEREAEARALLAARDVPLPDESSFDDGSGGRS